MIIFLHCFSLLLPVFLSRRLRKAEDRVRALETDKDAILASNAAVSCILSSFILWLCLPNVLRRSVSVNFFKNTRFCSHLCDYHHHIHLSSPHLYAVPYRLQEAASLRAAHSKALEMLMGYQEENDLLRSAVCVPLSFVSVQCVLWDLVVSWSADLPENDTRLCEGWTDRAVFELFHLFVSHLLSVPCFRAGE